MTIMAGALVAVMQNKNDIVDGQAICDAAQLLNRDAFSLWSGE